jgi:CO dehydrogenase maturation factor
MCAAHATVRGLLQELTTPARTVVMDLEAGLEHLSRGTPRHVDTILLVAEPYFKSMETAARSKTLAEELGVARTVVVANKVRGTTDEEAMQAFFARIGLPLVGVVPADDRVLEADRRGRAPLDHDATSPAMAAIVRLADELTAITIRSSGGLDR